MLDFPWDHSFWLYLLRWPAQNAHFLLLGTYLEAWFKWPSKSRNIEVAVQRPWPFTCNKTTRSFAANRRWCNGAILSFHFFGRFTLPPQYFRQNSYWWKLQGNNQLWKFKRKNGSFHTETKMYFLKGARTHPILPNLHKNIFQCDHPASKKYVMFCVISLSWFSVGICKSAPSGWVWWIRCKAMGICPMRTHALLSLSDAIYMMMTHTFMWSNIVDKNNSLLLHTDVLQQFGSIPFDICEPN